MTNILPTIYIIIGFILLIKGADILVDGSSSIAKKFHIPEIVIGLTIVSIGTSLPELLVSLNSSLKGYTDMALGNVIGSSLCNLLLILGVSAIIKPLKFKRETRIIEIPICAVITIIFAILCNTGGQISRQEAVILVILFLMFIIYTIVMAKKGEEFDKEDDELEEEKQNKKETTILKNIIFIILGIIGLKIGGDLIVDNSTLIAKNFNISEKIISLTILALGTSLPELVTSIVAATKGNSDISVGNIIGSNIFNMSIIIGTTSLITPISFNLTYNIELIILIMASVMLAFFSLIPPKNRISRKNGILYLMIYIFYMITLFLL